MLQGEGLCWKYRQGISVGVYELCGQIISCLTGRFLVSGFIKVNEIDIVLSTKCGVEKSVVPYPEPYQGHRSAVLALSDLPLAPVPLVPKAMKDPGRGSCRFSVNVSSPGLLLQHFSKSEFAPILMCSRGSEQRLYGLIKIVSVMDKPCCIKGRRN